MRGLVLALCAMTGTAFAEGFDELEGWAGDDHAAALRVFRSTCDLVPDLAQLCAATPDDPRQFFENNFRLVPTDAFFTGYYEPELRGSLTRSAEYAHPIYALPPEGPPPIPRADMHAALHGRGLEIAWLDDPAEAFFLQVQGSGRIRLPDGGTIRVGYAGKNGLPYQSIGKELVRRGSHTPEQASAQGIKAYIRANPTEGLALMNHNPSFVFFRKLDLPADTGPIGTMGRPVTALRSLAVDPEHIPLGLPVWVQKDGLAQLFIAQDTGSAIKGPTRADIFYGTGAGAGEAAGTVADNGRMFVLVPR